MDVLITDSNPELANGLRRMFERHGHKADCANVDQLFKAMEKRPYSILVLDWQLPDAAGLISKLRRAGRTVPVLALAGRAGTDELVQALNGGADDFVVKADAPVEVLLARAAALHRRACYPASPRRVEANGIVIDEAARSVTVKGKHVDVAPSELRALSLLAVSMGKIVSRAELITVCWGEGADASDNALESIMKRLRRKLGNEGARIRSVRLRGYVLVERAD